MSYGAFLAEKLDVKDPSLFQGLSFSKANAKLKEIATGNSPEEIAKAQAEYLGLPLATVSSVDIDEELTQILSLHHCKMYSFLPLKKVKNTIHIATSAPEKSLPIIDDYTREMAVETELFYMPEEYLLKLIHATWDKHSMNAADVVDDMDKEDNLDALAHVSDDLLDRNDDAPIIRLINSILSQSMKDGASDIHIEPFEKNVKVRFRVDGVMHTVVEPSSKMHAAMSARLKVMANLDIAEKRLPQDGRFKIKLAGKETDIRMSTLPTQYGERIVLRLLGGQETGVRAIDQIGLRDEQLKMVRDAFNLSNGMIYICGPTGSGKTSSLYAGLTDINTPDKNIVTVEDPVEYEIEGLGQIQVNSKIGMTFAAGLRSILRQDPDVVVVGETRDLETAQISVESSLTGHLVLSTIHTNDAASTVTRLIEMGIEPFLVASSMRLVIAQRMIRRLNPVTKVPRTLDAETKKLFDALPENVRPKNITLFDAASSPDSPSGYKGRTGIFEILQITENVRSLINSSASDADIKQAAQQEGMLTLYQEGLLRAAKGETTLEEVIRVTRVHT